MLKVLYLTSIVQAIAEHLWGPWWKSRLGPSFCESNTSTSTSIFINFKLYRMETHLKHILKIDSTKKTLPKHLISRTLHYWCDFVQARCCMWRVARREHCVRGEEAPRGRKSCQQSCNTKHKAENIIILEILFRKF